MGRLSIGKRNRINALIQEGFPSRFIASREKVAQSTVIRIKQKVVATGSVKDLPKSGRPRLFTGRDERNIIRMLSSGECSTAVDIQKNLKNNSKISVSENTVRRVLYRNGLSSRVKRKKPYLKKKHRQLRLNFAKKYKNWGVEEWSKIIWSDESKFMIFGSDGRKYCWKKPKEPLTDRHVVPTVKFGGGCIMVWGCFSSFGVGNIVRIYGNMNGELYRQILKDDLLGTIEWHGVDKSDIIFQQDNDPKHTANLTWQWFEDNDIDVLEWPPQSPDLNPIEHLWNEIDRRMRRSSAGFHTQDQLWDAVQKAWVEMDIEFLNRLIESMPERIDDVIRANGGYTRW
jgi:transposase